MEDLLDTYYLRVAADLGYPVPVEPIFIVDYMSDKSWPFLYNLS